VQLAGKIDRAWLDEEIAPLYSDKGRPGIVSRFAIGLLLLKHMFGLSDEGVCERWVYDPYFQHFTGLGVKVSIVTTNACSPGGQFVPHAAALPGNPYDGRTLRAAIEDTQHLTGREIERAYVDKGYRGHDTPKPRSVFISGQKRGVFGAIKRELRRRSAVEPLIGHMKEQGHLGRCYLKGHAGDAANATLTAAGYNFRRILAWFSMLLRLILAVLMIANTGQPTPNPAP